jgi:histidyl-tRNA synthetase
MWYPDRVSQKLQAPRGTRDFYPEQMRIREWLFGHFREVARSYGFEEVDAPIVESEELFTRKAGEEIVEQLYAFELHGHRLALRPEMTPSIARLVMARAGGLRLPIRWFAITQNWRYERMQRGRGREHYQWNMDIWGEPGVAAEAELIAAIFRLLGRIGLGEGQARVRINSRALLEEWAGRSVLAGRPEAFPALCVVIDKIAKIGPDAVAEQLTDPKGAVRIGPGAAKDVVARLSLTDVEAAAEGLPADSEPLADLERLFELLDAYGVADRVDFDASITRGLAYYTGIVFEGFDAARSLRSICGGGRYDRLTETLGGKPIPAVGFGFGDMVIVELLEQQGLLPALERDLDAMVFAFTEAERPAAIRLAGRLRDEGLSVELALAGGKLKRALADADKAGAGAIYLLGPEELARGVALVRDLETGDQTERALES